MDFRGAVHEHWNAVFRFLLTLCGNEHEAEDFTQESFTRALERFSTFRPGTNQRAWLLRIASNAFFDERRKRRRRRQQSLQFELPANNPDPSKRLETFEEAERIAAALQELTELTRMVFHLRVREELSFQEIAELAGTTEQSARWHMHHARSHVLARLGKIDQKAT